MSGRTIRINVGDGWYCLEKIASGFYVLETKADKWHLEKVLICSGKWRGFSHKHGMCTVLYPTRKALVSDIFAGSVPLQIPLWRADVLHDNSQTSREPRLK